MLQCGLLRSNFALAIHVHLVRPRLAPACKTAAGYCGIRPCSSRKFCANVAAKRLYLGTQSKTAIGRDFYEPPARPRQTDPGSAAPAAAGRKAAGVGAVAAAAAAD